MRWRIRHWAAALALSVAAHGLAALTFARVDAPVEIERSAGDPIAVSAANVMAAFQAEMAEAEPVETIETPEPVEAQPVAARAPDERPETVRQSAPAPPVRADRAEPNSASPARTMRSEQPASRVLTVSRAARVGAMPLGESEERKTLARVADVPGEQPVEANKPRTTEPPAEPVEAALPDATRQQPARTAERPATVRSAEPVEPDRTAEAVERSPPAERAAPVERTRQALAAETVAVPLAKPEPPARPETAPPARQTPEVATADPPRKQPAKRKAKPRKRTASKDTGSERSSKASSGQAGSNAHGKSARKAGDGGRSRGVSGKAAMSNYLGKVIARLQRQKRYPSEARRRQAEGTAVVAFVINANGSVAGVRLSRSAGDTALDQAVLAMVRRAAPFPPIPSGAGRNRIPISVPIRFTVR